MRGLSLLLILLSVLLGEGAFAPAAWAADDVCPADRDLSPPVVVVETKLPETRYVFDHNRSDLTGVSHKTNLQALPSAHDYSVGLTVVEGYSLNYTTKVERMPVGRGRICFWIREIHLIQSWHSVTVYVANNYPRQSCEFQVILGHENQHVAINQRVLRNFGTNLEVALRRAAPTMSPYIGISPSEEQRSATLVGAVVDQVLPELERNRSRENGAIDTPASYHMTQSRCQHW